MPKRNGTHSNTCCAVGSYATRTGTRVRIQLRAAEGWNDEVIARVLDVGQVTVERTHQRFVEEGWGHWRSGHALGNSPNWMRRWKPACSLQPVVPHRKATNAGPCHCLPIVSLL
jgi:Homeodomain-like domain